MTFGQIKSIIEKNLVESYKDTSSFKQTLKEFKHNVLTNKSFSKVYSIYDDLSSAQGLTESDAREFLDEAINVIRHLLEKTSLPKNGEKSENIYENIDNIVYFNKVDIKERIASKKAIISKLMESKGQVKDTP
jgi:polyhydroxyalkanoate synthesis regulator phasin